MTFSHHLWGMHYFWWIFWIIVVAALLMWGWPSRLETALETLRRRYAAGEISEEEYRHQLSVLGESSGPNTRSAA